MLGLDALIGNHYTRYNLILIGPYAVGAAWIIASWLPGGRARVGDGDLPRQRRYQLHLRAQLQMQVQHHHQTDDHPDIENEIDAAADADQACQPRRVRRQPDKVQARGRDGHRHQADRWRAEYSVQA